MNRAFKIQFHNGAKDEKTIVTMAVTVNNGKLFHALDNEGKRSLLKKIRRFQDSLEVFKVEILDSFTYPKEKI